jgi:predicted ATP-dependent serine protease
MQRFLFKLNLQNKELETKLNNSKFKKISEILETDFVSLSEQLDISFLEARNLIRRASETIIKFEYPSLKTVLQLGDDKKYFLKTNLYSLDEAFYGGIPGSSVTEIASPKGIGKTQLMHTLGLTFLNLILQLFKVYV